MEKYCFYRPFYGGIRIGLKLLILTKKLLWIGKSPCSGDEFDEMESTESVSVLRPRSVDQIITLHIGHIYDEGRGWMLLDLDLELWLRFVGPVQGSFVCIQNDSD